MCVCVSVSVRVCEATVDANNEITNRKNVSRLIVSSKFIKPSAADLHAERIGHGYHLFDTDVIRAKVSFR